MKIKILDVKTLGDGLDFSPINELGEITVYDLTMQSEVIERIKDAEVLVLNKVKLNKENLPFAKKLRLICITATGYDNVDIEYCKSNNIAVCNVAGYSTDSVVQLTAAMVFSLASRLNVYDRYVKSGAYTKSGIFNRVEPAFYELSGMTWGIAGLGNIGKKVAALAQAVGCRVLAYKKTPVEEFECVDLDTLCEESDIITVHTPLNDETYHMINAEQISKMKKNVILVNVARGAVFDEKAAADAVLEGRIGALGVDVYSTEPMQADSPYQRLLNMDNVIFTPHMAWGAKDARQRCIDEVAKNIESFLDGKNRSRIV